MAAYIKRAKRTQKRAFICLFTELTCYDLAKYQN